MFAPKKILVPTDFSKFSDSALKQAVDMAIPHKTTIYLFHVVDVVRQCTVDYCLDAAMVDAIEKKSVKAAQGLIEEQIKRVVKTDKIKIIADIKTGGAPYEEILHEQKTKKVDLIVIACRGQSAALRHLIGGVAEKVARSATAPVFLVRGSK
jgi:universal stress protein A